MCVCVSVRFEIDKIAKELILTETKSPRPLVTPKVYFGILQELLEKMGFHSDHKSA